MRTGLHAFLASAFCIIMAFGLLACGGGGSGEETTPPAPSTVTAQSVLPVGDSHCPFGGVQLDYGIDDNKNGLLDPVEADGSEYICNGADGMTALINTTTLAVGDANCLNGGYQVDSGLDLDNSGALENSNSNGDDEITSTSYLCNEVYAPLAADTISSSRIDLDWSAMAGDPSVAFYEVYRDRSWIFSTADATTTTYSATGLAASTVYCFMVTGMDSLYNVVVQSPEVCATTSGGHNRWKATDITGPDLPSERQNHSAVWAGTKMIVWGGNQYEAGIGYTYFNTGGIYDPATDTWTAMSTANAPEARRYHTAVWTGSKMIVWGGSGGTVLNTGGIYDPATDTWTAMSTVNAPAARWGHTAIWTGSKMIVWGGYNTASGGIYDPVTDTWTVLPTANAPSARWDHTAVWSGDKMIVWGGQGLSGGYIYFNDGGLYDPVTNIWTAMSTANAPAERYLHTAVWTGDKMIVWGGSDSTILFNTGGMYDPVTDTWSISTLANAPTARRYHTAVWTGSKMVVWGGQELSGVYYNINTGGTYNPSTDTWAATSTTGAPAASHLHTAVWTGFEMVVWGGLGGPGAGYIEVNTGGLYTP